MVTVYVDVLVALNLYITWFLLLASERLAGSRGSKLRRGLAALVGGLSSLAIFLPELPFPILVLGKLGLAGIITWIAGGTGGWKGFCKRMGFFFGANFLFAGCMIALWFLAEPSRLTIRNGMVYYHIPALTLALSTIIAYGAVRIFAFFRDRSTPENLTYRAEITLRSCTVSCDVFLDTGNRLKGPGGLPVVLCCRELLEKLVPKETAEVLLAPEKAAALTGTGWESRLRFIPCQSVGGTRLLCGIEPDLFFVPGKGKADCILAPAGDLSGDGWQAITGPMEFRVAEQGQKNQIAGRDGRNHV